MDLKESLVLIQDLLTPATKLEQVNLNQINLNDILGNIIENFENSHKLHLEIESEDHSDNFWKFGLICLHLIKNLNDCKFEPSPNGCYLSVTQERQLSSVCQLVTCFGIHYNLEDHVGISISKLSRYGVNILAQRDKVDPTTRNRRLHICLSYLFSMKSNIREHVDFMHKIFYGKYLHDLICALIQILHSPNSINEKKIIEPYSNWLENDLFNESDGSNIVSSLIMAQGSYQKNKSPIWFINTIGKLLTKCLLRPNSVMNVIRAVLQEINAISNVSVASDWKKCDIVARILSQCPASISAEEYVKFISPQLLHLYFTFDPRFVKHFYRIAGSIYALFSERWPEHTRKYLTESIISPIIPTLEKFIDSDEFHEQLTNIHLVYVDSNEPNWKTLKQMPVSLLHLLFDCYLFIKDKNNKINNDKKESTLKLIEGIITVYVRMMPEEQGKVIGLFDEILTSRLLPYKETNKYRFEAYPVENEDNDEIIKFRVITDSNSQISVTIQMVELRAQTLTSIIKKLNDPQIEINFMFYLFEKIIYHSKNQDKTNDIKQEADQTLLNIENTLINEGESINLKIIYFTQLSYLFENINSQLIIDNFEKIIDFCQVILKSLIELMTKNMVIDDTIKQNEFEIVHLVLSILSVFTTGLIEIDYNAKVKLQIMLPILHELKNIYTQIDLSEMCESLIISIATYCGVKTEPQETEPKRRLIEEIKMEESDSEYERAMKDLKDPLIPVKAHGLVALRKLIEKKDKKCFENRQDLIDKFIRYLKFDDSYVYLAAINCLISLVDYEPNKILDVLIEQYLTTNSKLDMENRLKIGEVLTKTVRNFGELVPKYGPRLLNTFLSGCRHTDELFRSSCLSNLGETCKLLNYSINDNIHEIMNCLSSLIDTDKSIEVKRSAVLVLKMIFEGLDKRNFVQVLGGSLLPLYRLLSKTKQISNDDTIRLNCQLAIEYLNELMKNSMFPEMKLEKEIKVLRP